MTDLQILDTYGYTMCPARSEFPTIGTLAGGDVRLLMDGTIRASVVLQYRPHEPGVNPLALSRRAVGAATVQERCQETGRTDG